MGHDTSIVTHFILVGLPTPRKVEMLLLLLFLLIYLLIWMGNLLIIALIIVDYRLHNPMYFFLANFSFLEIMVSTVVVPKAMANLVSQNRTISFAGCLTQCYFYFSLGTAQFLLLAAMSLDRYVAICNPLRYLTIMSWRTCISLLIFSCAGALLCTLFPTVLKFSLVFCGSNKINHFFCDAVALIKLSCVDAKLLKLVDFITFSLVILGSLIMTTVSYVYIIITILRIPTAGGRQKAFSTCVAHLTTVSLGYGSVIFMYVRPIRGSSVEYNKIVSVLTIFVTPALNPFIFSLRNKNVKQALQENILEKKTVNAHQKKELWRAIANKVRTLEVQSLRIAHCQKRWEDLRHWARKIAEAQLGMFSESSAQGSKGDKAQLSGKASGHMTSGQDTTNTEGPSGYDVRLRMRNASENRPQVDLATLEKRHIIQTY
ncbi:olfactory receptor 6M1-like [Pleurodeles waltl]|uniref:olfactory receptor 6M1-like n=1 Tax=Pleurodeles waltl TaxID=8319 RepID=UPI003709AC48